MKKRLQLFQQARGVEVDVNATEGAVVGVNLYLQDGTVVTEEMLFNGVDGDPVEGNDGVVFWRTIQEIPDNLIALAELTGKGGLRKTGEGTFDLNAGPLPPINFSYGDASPAAMTTFAVTSEVMLASLQIEQAFDGAGASLTLGTAANPAEIFDTFEVLPGEVATFEFTPRVEYPAGTALVLTINPGAGATQGSGQLVISAIPTY